eukprot:2929983-Pyramimonas_sp.AAC.2
MRGSTLEKSNSGTWCSMCACAWLRSVGLALNMGAQCSTRRSGMVAESLETQVGSDGCFAARSSNLRFRGDEVPARRSTAAS